MTKKMGHKRGSTKNLSTKGRKKSLKIGMYEFLGERKQESEEKDQR